MMEEGGGKGVMEEEKGGEGGRGRKGVMEEREGRG